MKYSILTIILCFTLVNAQTIGKWTGFVNGNQRGIFTYSLPDSAKGQLLVRCDGSLLEIFVGSLNTPAPKINILEDVYYQINGKMYNTSSYLPSENQQTAFFSQEDIRKIIPNFLTSRYFSATIPYEDFMRTYSFELTGFGQILSSIPCAEEYLKSN